MALCAPLMGLICIAIRLDSNGPALIVQERLGRGLRPFRMYKFRSMVDRAESLLPSLLDRNETDGPIFKMRRDPRITRVGRYLRRLSIDELPQLINVLWGEMALVGPRPPFANEVVQDYLRQAIRLQCPPGMTGIWQVSGRSGLSYDMMIGLDLGYALHWSMGRDIAILLRTFPAVVMGRGAV
jgi:lipopolysaccharide/colanic/teichoic acid biosynthesis glycosyltransferase